MSVAQLAKSAKLDLDEALIVLWDNGFNYVLDQESFLSGGELAKARRLFSIPSARQIKAISYWRDKAKMTVVEFNSLLADLGIEVSKEVKTLPIGAHKKLAAHFQRSGVAPLEVPRAVLPVAVDNTFEWRTVGKEKEVRCLDSDEILSIHDALVNDFNTHSDPIFPPGLRDEHLLGSAVTRQTTSMGGVRKYPTAEMVAAALLHSLVLNHCFHNGNKRTALVAVLVLLDENETMLTCDEDELFKFVLRVAQHRVMDNEVSLTLKADAELIAIAEWIRANSRHIQTGERPISFKKLKTLLHPRECSFVHSTNGCNVKITRFVKKGLFIRKVVPLTCNIAVGNEGRDIDRPTMSKIRKELELTEELGVDSALFYGDVPYLVDSFMVKYRKTLRRLAKV